MTEIQDYVRLSVFLGGFKDLIQGSGGNFSVKLSESQLCIKSSGKLLAETTPTSGYVICSIPKLEELYSQQSDQTGPTVIAGDQSTPSMEVFFHLLPFKWIVHCHPTNLLKQLCQKDWSSIPVLPNLSALFIPYKTPGFELSTCIRSCHRGEPIVFLQNHGLIVCGDSIEEVLYHLDLCLQSDTLKLWKFQTHIHETTGQDLVLKPCQSISNFHDRFFLPITPDISLFLKQYPLAQETRDETLEHLWDTYRKQLNTTPAVIKVLSKVYVLGKSYRQCGCIEDILQQYLQIVHSVDPNRLEFFQADSIISLQTSEKEIHRLNSL